MSKLLVTKLGNNPDLIEFVKYESLIKSVLQTGQPDDFLEDGFEAYVLSVSVGGLSIIKIFRQIYQLFSLRYVMQIHKGGFSCTEVNSVSFHVLFKPCSLIYYISDFVIMNMFLMI